MPAKLMTIQTPVRFSDSVLYSLQNNYFKDLSIQAWKTVPFHISSNPFTAYHYALLAVNFIKDWHHRHPENKNVPFYIVEMGSGSGKFSFYFLKYFKELLSLYQRSEQKFTYIITDLVQENLDFCKYNESLQPFIQAGELDFSLFNLETDTDFSLQIAHKKLSQNILKTPVLIIANYVFDCLKQDAFQYVKGECHEVHIGVQSPQEGENIYLNMKKMNIHYQLKKINPFHYYEDTPILHAILLKYHEIFKEKDGSFLIPVGGIQFLNTMSQLTKNNFFLISGDVGSSKEHKNAYHPILNAVYFFKVNFAAIAHYFQITGGDALLSYCESFGVNLFCKGEGFHALVETTACFKKNINRITPADFISFQDAYVDDFYGICVYLRMNYFDPKAYSLVHTQLLIMLENPKKHDLKLLEDILEKISDNIYTLPVDTDYYQLLGIIHQKMQRWDKALAFYLKSLLISGDNETSHYNAALLYEKKGNSHKALAHYQQAIKLNKKNKVSKRKVAQLLQKWHVADFYPFLKGLLVVSSLQCVFYFIR